MKTAINALLAIIILWASIFGLHKLGIVTINGNDGSNSTSLTWENQVDEWETINDMPLDDSGDVAQENNNETTGNNAIDTTEPTIQYLNTPYTDTAEVGSFTKLWELNSNTSLYSYKVKLWGNIWWVENKWIEYSKNNQLSWIVKYINNNGEELSLDTKLNANEVVYVSLQSDTISKTNDTVGETTASVSSNEWNKEKSKAENCVKYQAFFECVLNKISGVDPDIMRNNLNAFMNAISNLTSTEQDAKCSNLIYEIKSKSANSAQAICIDKL